MVRSGETAENAVAREAGIVDRADVRNAVAVRAMTLVERLHG